jgi:histidine kinase/DNA gyrase B/HSP90-like ATPase
MADSDVTTEKTPLVEPAEFVVGGMTADKIEVRISYAIIDRFSEGLYSSPNKAFEELVSNSYDAGAHRVWVRVPESLKGADAYLAVIDDGVSMDLDGLRALWQVGVSPKRADDGAEVVHEGRAPIGKFGIGKLATYVLAEELTYVCRADGHIRAVTMDYGRAKGEMSDPKPMSLEVVDLSDDDARKTLAAAMGADDPVLDELFGADAPPSWTAAVLSRLKPRGVGVQSGRLRWILRTALPLGDQFKLWFNREQIESAKVDAVPPWEFIVGESDKGVDGWPYADKIATDSEGRVGVDLPNAGFIHGAAQLFDISLKGGKSDERARSHGFFVKVRERLVNLDDETFGIDVELHHGVLTRFRMEVHADGLDEHLSSPRESIQESVALKEVRDYLLAVFNRARSYRAKQEEKTDADLLASSERIAGPPQALSTGPLRRVLRRVLAGEEALGQLLDLDPDALGEAEKALASHDTLLQQVLIEPLGHEKPLVRYSVQQRAAIVNADHPFVSNYLDVHGAAEPLRLVGVTELLTQIYMVDEDLDPRLVHKILNRRDEFLRALVNIHPRSAVVVARQLRDSRSMKDELEDAVADALELMGFDVTRISGNGKPDGIARAMLGARQEGGGSRNYAVTYDAKSSGKDAIKAATAGSQTLRKHRKTYGADYSLLVAPGFQGAKQEAKAAKTSDGKKDEEAAIVENCTTDKITPITVDQLARVVELFPFRSLTPESIVSLFEAHTPAAVTKWVDELATSPAGKSPPPITELLVLIRDLSDSRDAVTVPALSTALKLQHKIELSVGELRGLLRGLAALAPNALWFEADQIALNASIPKVVKELTATIEPLSDEIAGLFKQALAKSGAKT